jgi:hypothetical protein
VVMRSSPLPRMSRRGRVTVGVLVGVFLLFTLLGWGVNAWTDWLWFDEVHYTKVFTGVLQTRLLLFLAIGLAVSVVIGGNLWLAFRLRPLLRPHSAEQATLERYRMALAPRIGTWIAIISGIVGLFAGLSAQGRWAQWLLFRNAQPFGTRDPIFNVDIGFYVFEYPFYRYLLGVGFTAVVLSVIGALAVHYVFGGVRLQGVGDRMTNAARAHLTTLVAVFVLFKAVAYILDRRALLLSYNEGAKLYGAGYADINALLPAKEILAYISIVVAVAIVIFSNAVMRNLVWPGVSLALLGISAIAIGGIYPWSVQSFSVNPSLLDKERPYIKNSIDATRDAFGISGSVVAPYQASNQPPPASLATDTSVVPHIRLLDPQLLSETYTQLQQVRGFYDFGEKLDIDRYRLPINQDTTQDYVVGLREIDYTELTPQQSNWLNRHTIYTHGYGLVGAPANRVVCGGQPYFVSGFLGEQSQEQCSSPTEQIEATQPRIYYGEQMRDQDYAIVGSRGSGANAEFDRPISEQGGDQYYTYQGTGGVKIGSFTRKLLYAIKEQESNFLLSEAVNDNSRLMYVRNPRDRVEKVAPFLKLDGDPYPAAVDGKIVWIIDGWHLPLFPAGQPAVGDHRRTDQRRHVPAGARGHQLHPQLGEGDGRRLRRHGDALRVRRQGSGAQGVEQGVRRSPGGAEGEDAGGPGRSLPLPERPVQGATQPAGQVPRHRSDRVLLRARLLGGAQRARLPRPGPEAAAVLPRDHDAGPDRAAVPADVRAHPGLAAKPGVHRFRVLCGRAATAGGVGAARPDGGLRPGPGPSTDDQQRQHQIAAHPALVQPGRGAVRQPALVAVRQRHAVRRAGLREEQPDQRLPALAEGVAVLRRRRLVRDVGQYAERRHQGPRGARPGRPPRTDAAADRRWQPGPGRHAVEPAAASRGRSAVPGHHRGAGRPEDRRLQEVRAGVGRSPGGDERLPGGSGGRGPHARGDPLTRADAVVIAERLTVVLQLARQLRYR